MTDVVSLADVKTHLRYPDTDDADDAALQGFISAADEVIIREVGHVIPQQFDEYYDGGDPAIYVRNLPILSVQNVEEGWGWIDYELDYVQVNTIPATSMFAYSVDIPKTGKISRRSTGNVNIPFIPGDGNIHVTYTAGRSSVPGNVRLFALEVIRYWWQNSQQRSGSNASPGEYGYSSANIDFTRTSGISAINQGIPNGLLMLLKGHRRSPIIG